MKNVFLLFILIELFRLPADAQIASAPRPFEANTETTFPALLDRRKTPGSQKEERVRYMHYGFIPYQLLSRSSALYFQYDLRYHFSLEAKLGYTYRQRGTEDMTEYFFGSRGYFLYQGANNAVAFSYTAGKRTKFSMMLVQRFWWYQNQWLPTDGVSTASSYSYSELKSSTLSGLGAGLGIAIDLGGSGPFDSEFFTNYMLIDCRENTSYTASGGYRAPPPGYGSVYPYTKISSFIMPSIAIGFKFGYKGVQRKRESK